MSYRVDAGFAKELQEFGKGDWNECYHCGNCTAQCPLTEQGFLFPRKGIRNLQMGLKETLASSTEPWLCYYCGDCSSNCPRNANPGELMMTLRRYLTTVYDWTGLAKKLYTSKVWEFGAIIVLALSVLFLWIWKTTPPPAGTHFANGGVPITQYAPVHLIHLGDWIMAGILVFFLVSNIINMFIKIILKDKTLKIPFMTYIKEFWSLIWHFGSQSKLLKCETKLYWGAHWFLMTGYVLLFAMIVFLLPWFQDYNANQWPIQRILGYYATIGLFVGIVYFTYNRIAKAEEHSKHSHVTDWTFLVLLFLTTLSGILLHFFRLSGAASAWYYTYLIHLMVLVPMLMIEVPFSKWSHLAYRPFAIYFANLKKAALIKNISVN